MPFDRTKIAKVSGFQSNCGLNCLVHSIIKHWDYIDGLHNQGRAQAHPVDGENGLLQHFRAYYGDSALTKHEMISMLRRISPYQREVVLGPVLRKMLPNVIRNYYPEDWARMIDPTNNANSPEVLRHRNRLGEAGEYLSGDDMHYLVHHFGIKLGLYEGNTEFDSAVLANERQFNNYPLNAPLLKIWNNGGHWQYEESMSEQELRNRNAEYERSQSLLNEEQIRIRIRDALAKAPANQKANINLGRIISPRPLLPFLSNNNDSNWEEFFAKMTNMYAPLAGPIISMVTVFNKLVQSLIKDFQNSDTGRKFSAEELKEYPEAKAYNDFLKKHVEDDEDVRDFRAKFRAEKGSKECWDDLADKFESDENYSALNSLLALQQRKLLGEGRIGKNVFADDLELGQNSEIEQLYRNLLAELTHLHDPNDQSNHLSFSNTSEEYQAFCCRIRRKLITALEKAQLDAFEITRFAEVDPEGNRVLNEEQRLALDEIAVGLRGQIEDINQSAEVNQAIVDELNHNVMQANLAQSDAQVRQLQQERDQLNARLAALQQPQQQQQRQQQQPPQANPERLQEMLQQFRQFQQQAQQQQAHQQAQQQQPPQPEQDDQQQDQEDPAQLEDPAQPEPEAADRAGAAAAT